MGDLPLETGAAEAEVGGASQVAGAARAEGSAARVFLLAAGSRVIVLVAGLLMPVRFENAVSASLLPPPGWRSLLFHWYRWDAVHYLEIALQGYSYDPTPGIYSNVAFLPLLPALLAVSRLLGLDPWVMGLLLPNLAFCVGLVLLAKTVVRLTGSWPLATRACVLLCCFPTAFYFSAPYQESLGFCFLALTFWAWTAKRPTLAALAIAVACTARQVALVVAGGFVLDWALARLRGRRPGPGAFLVLAGALLGFGAVLAYMQHAFGDALVVIRAERAWGRDPPGLLNLLRVLRPVSADPSAVIDYGTMLALLALGVHAWRRRGPLWGSATLLPVLLPMSTGTVLTMKRYALSAFPAFVDAAELLRRRWVFWSCAALGALLQLVLLYWYVNWGFVRILTAR